MGHKRTRDELLEKLEEQRLMLKASSDGYDAGNLWEAARLATHVYNIVNDGRGNKTKSILTQMHLRSSIKFHSSIGTRPKNFHVVWQPAGPLCMLRSKNEEGKFIAIFEPFLDRLPWPPRFLSFKDWWDEGIFTNSHGAVLTRLNLTASLRNKDGGSHVDEEIPYDPYLDLKLSTVGAIVKHTNDQGEEVEASYLRNGHLATMRQIAWELEKSLEVIPRYPKI